MHKIPCLQPGDSVEIIAPASRCTDQQLINLQNLLTSWQLNCIVDHDIFGKDLLCANSDENRMRLLKNALLRKETKAVICARGGYGSMRLISALNDLDAPTSAKLFVGMSDITALNLFLQQQWHWPTIHGALAIDKFSPESIAATRAILFGETDKIERAGIPLNAHAEKNQQIEAIITGGNLSLVQTSLGTNWQVDTQNKIVFLEEVGERGYRVDRMLEHLQQAGIFSKAVAIVFGDFLEGKEPDGTSLVRPVLLRFAASVKIPVILIDGVGHGPVNFPLLLGSKAILKLGEHAKLTSFREK